LNGPDNANGWAGGGAAWRAAGGFVLAAALLAVSAAPAAAQINPYKQTQLTGPDDLDEDAARGPSAVPGLLGYSRGLELAATVSSRYEDNLGRQRIKDDGVRVRPQALATYGLGLGRGGLFVQSSYGRDFIYGTSRLLTTDRLMLGGGVDVKLARCTGELGGSWRRGLSFASDAALFGGFSQEIANAGVAGECRIGGALSVNGSVLRSDIKTVRDSLGGQPSRAFDMRRWSYSGGVGFGTAALGQFSLSGSINDSIMPGRLVPTPTGFVEEGLKQRSARFGYARQFGSKLQLSGGISYLDTRPSSSSTLIIIGGVPQIVERTGYRGIGYDAALDLILSPRLSINATAGRNTFANGLVGAAFTVADYRALVVQYQLGSRYTVGLGVNQRHNQFRGAFLSPLEPLRRISDDFTRIYGQFGGRLGRRLRFSVDVTHTIRASNPSALSYNSTGVGLTLGYRLGREQ
jgi:hypothetical protein